jgi:hypothetical protein
MSTEKLIELYGRRYSPYGRVLIFLLILVLGILLTFVQ